MPNTEQLATLSNLTKAATGGYKESCSQKFPNVHRKTPVLELLLSLTLLKETPSQMFYRCEIIKNTYFEEHLGTAASELTLESDCFEVCFWTVAFKTILNR